MYKLTLILLIATTSLPTLSVAEEQEWLLMSRHGSCVPIVKASEHKSILVGIKTPAELISRLKSKQLKFTTQPVDLANSSIITIEIPEEKVSFIFAKTPSCKSIETGPR